MVYVHGFAGLVFLAVIGYYAYLMVPAYRAATGTTWQKLLAAGESSATKLWSRIVQIFAAILGVVASCADFLNAPQVADAIHQYLKPEYVAGAFVVIMAITTLARNRTLDQ